jgi:hypothetical protein
MEEPARSSGVRGGAGGAGGGDRSEIFGPSKHFEIFSLRMAERKPEPRAMSFTILIVV